MSTVSDLSLIRFLKRFAAIKSEIKEAQVRIGDINAALQDNVDKQKILNQHLAKQNEAWRALRVAPQSEELGAAKKPTLTLVKSSQLPS